MKTLVIGDIHLRYDPKRENYLDSQIKNIYLMIYDIQNKYDTNLVIFLGDIFDRRQPYIQELLAFNNLCKDLAKINIRSIFIRGNHDTLYKSQKYQDETSLKLFFKDFNKVVYDSWDYYNLVFVAHFEDPNIILSNINSFNFDKNSILLGHFGYKGSLPGTHINDVEIDIDDLKCNTILGHIHKFNHTINSHGHSVITLGIPHPLAFHDTHENYYVALLTLDTNKIELLEVKPKIVYHDFDLDIDNSESVLSRVKDDVNSDHFIFLNYRFKTSSHISNHIYLIKKVRELLNSSNKGYYITDAYKPVFKTIGSLSSEEFKPDDFLTKDFLEDYADNNNANLDPTTLKEVLKDIIDESTKD